jgi:ubiquitin C-terminal hydrolase
MALLDQCSFRTIFGKKLDDEPDLKKNDPILSFSFSMVNRIECTQCHHSVQRVEEHTDLALDLPEYLPNHSLSLVDLIESFVKSEEVIYNCERCDSKKALIHHEFSTLPKTLLLHIKRFGSSFMKRKDALDIPLSLDHIAVSPVFQTKKYKLVGFISHLGSSMSKGHYIFDLLLRDQTWTRFDDAFLSRHTGLENRSRNAYIIMYQSL